MVAMWWLMGRKDKEKTPRGRGTLSRRRQASRDFLEKLRETGVQTGGPAPLAHTDRKRFADQLDRFLARQGNRGTP